MAEQTFRSPGFYEQEIELVAGAQQPVGVPGGVIGTAQKGPAFVPVTLANMTDFVAKFGDMSPQQFAPYAVNEFLKHKQSLTFVRVLGGGANSNASDISDTLTNGTVKNAGFKITPAASTADGVNFSDSTVQFLVARHYVSASSAGPTESEGFPVYTDNPTFGISGYGGDSVNLVRAVIFPASGTRIQVAPYDKTFSPAALTASLGPDALTNGLARRFKLIISSAAGTSFDSDDGFAGVKILTASLDPGDSAYISRVLNTDPDLFASKKHLLYLDFPVEKDLVPVQTGTAVTDPTVLILSGNSSNYRTAFGRYDTRFTTPQTPSFISQPFGSYEYDLFHFESISDGEYANDKLKISIANIQASTDPDQPFGTFDVILRQFGDDDINPQGLEYYPALSLNSKADNYIAKAIGDKKVRWNFDADDSNERRLLISGKYPNRSVNIRVVMNPAVESGQVPPSALPFGFRGIPVLKTVDSLTDYGQSLSFGGETFTGGTRLAGIGTSGNFPLTASVLPPLPFRYKVTRGTMSETGGNIGTPGANERADSRFYWGVVVQSMPTTSSVNNAVLNFNAGTLENTLVKSYTKFQGIFKQDVLVTGSAADVFNANKFTLARVALANGTISSVTGTAEVHMREAAYVRNGQPSAVDYRVNYASSNRVTMATLVASSSVVFNRFASFNKFTTVFYGGFDGLNILDRDNRLMNDRASSTESGVENGKAIGAIEAGLNVNAAGAGTSNNVINAYRTAVDILTDEISSNINLLAIPGIRDSLVTTYAQDAARDYSLAMYIRDIPAYDDSGFRIFDDTTGRRPSVRQTSETFVGLNVDNNYAATYFPDVYISDNALSRRVKVPASVAALGAIAFNDRVAYPWFAPAGFNRAALDFVNNVQVRLNQSDRDTLYDARINPIATFPAGGFVIFGQKTLQLKKSALDRVNVRRLLLEVKRVISQVAGGLLFEQNTPAVRSRFIASANPQLALIQAQAGIEKFRVIMDDTNNTPQDAEQNRLNGKIVIVPTKTVEFIAIDFVITPSGVSFE